MSAQIETKADKLITDGFIREVQYSSWLTNIVPIKKRMDKLECVLTFVVSMKLVLKNGQIRVCILDIIKFTWLLKMKN